VTFLSSFGIWLWLLRRSSRSRLGYVFFHIGGALSRYTQAMDFPITL
jgi:hypothetical protein